MENNVIQTSALNESVQEQKVVQKMPQNIRIIFFFYVLILLAFYLFGYIISKSDHTGLSLAFSFFIFLPIFCVISFSMGLRGLILLKHSNKTMTSFQRTFSLLIFIIMLTCFTPFVLINFLGNTLSKSKILNKYNMAPRLFLTREDDFALSDRRKEYDIMSNYFNQERKVTGVFESYLIIENRFLVRLVGTNSVYGLSLQEKTNIKSYLENHYKDKNIMFSIPPLSRLNVTNYGQLFDSSPGKKAGDLSIETIIYDVSIKGESVVFPWYAVIDGELK